MALKSTYGSELLEKITITKRTKDRIKYLALKKGLKQITILEYLLNGKIKLEELSN